MCPVRAGQDTTRQVPKEGIDTFRSMGLELEANATDPQKRV